MPPGGNFFGEMSSMWSKLSESSPCDVEDLWNCKKFLLLSTFPLHVFVLRIYFIYYVLFRTHIEELKEAYLVRSTDNCIVNHNHISMGVSRPPQNCNVCVNVTSVPNIYNLTQDYFLKHHAYSGTGLVTLTFCLCVIWVSRHTRTNFA